MLVKIYKYKIKFFILLVIIAAIALGLQKTSILLKESQNNQQNQIYEQNKNIIYAKLNYLTHIISQQDTLNKNGTDTNKLIAQELDNIIQGNNTISLKLYDLNGNLIQQKSKSNHKINTTSLLFNLISESKLWGFLVAEINIDETTNNIKTHVKNDFYAMFLLIFLSSAIFGFFIGFNLKRPKK